MTTLTVLIDSKEYIESNCYQRQLMKTLRESFDVETVTVDEFRFKRIPHDRRVVLSCLKLRTLHRELRSVSALVGNDRPMLVYEQDAWENFIVGSPYKDSYKEIAATLNVKSFLNTSKWWSDRVRDTGIPSTFVNMWMRPEYCSVIVPWKQRQRSVVFCGTIYPRRRAFFDKLEEQGIDVEIISAGIGYESYLELVSSCKIMIRSEKVDWSCDFGQGPTLITKPNALWIRDVECAARGCFTMREQDDERSVWGLDKVPSSVCFDDASDAATKVNKLLNMTDDEAETMLQDGIDIVRKNNKWTSVVNAIKTFDGQGVQSTQ